MKKGFTLIELMIVVAIIAIIAAIAIPNLMESKKSANEGNAGTALKTYCTAQATYQANNYSYINATSPTVADQKCFSSSFENLGGTNAHTNATSTPISLIPQVFAGSTNATTAWNGYFFDDMTQTAGTACNYKFNHGLCAVPAQYGNTGTNTYIVNEQAIVWMKDNSGNTPVTNFPSNPSSSGYVNP